MRAKFLVMKERRTTSFVSAEKVNENPLISQIITGVHNSIQNDPRLEGGVTHFLNNGIRSQVSAGNRSSNYSNRNDTEERRVVIYDHQGNHITNI